MLTVKDTLFETILEDTLGTPRFTDVMGETEMFPQSTRYLIYPWFSPSRKEKAKDTEFVGVTPFSTGDVSDGTGVVCVAKTVTA